MEIVFSLTIASALAVTGLAVVACAWSSKRSTRRSDQPSQIHSPAGRFRLL